MAITAQKDKSNLVSRENSLPKNKINSNVPPMYVFALGGLGEVGKNMYIFEQGNEIWIVDSGIKFSSEVAIDGIIPSFQYLIKNKEKVKGLIVTHGHEDHIGSIPHLLDAIKIPKIYAGRIAANLIWNKVRERGIARPKIDIINNKYEIKTRNFIISFFNVNHSIPDVYGVVFKSKHGTASYTADFKFDLTPVGTRADFHKMAKLGQEGLTLLLSDSTNSLSNEFSLSESVVRDTIDEIIKRTLGRIVIATFASNVYRVREIINLALKHNRKIAVFGYSMDKVVTIARRIKYINAAEQMFVEPKQIKNMKDEELLILSTGTQGESLAALSKMSDGRHKEVKLRKEDTVIFASSAIPGNYEPVEKVINNLIKNGVRVITNKTNPGVHASGHGGRQEQLFFLSLVRPKNFMPVHGEKVMQVKHSKTAIQSGVPKNNVFITDNGGRVKIENGVVSYAGVVEADDVYIDETSLKGQSSKIIGDRNQMSVNGVVVLSVAIDSTKNELASATELITKGSVALNKSSDFFKEVTNLVSKRLSEYYASGQKISFARIKEIIRMTGEEMFLREKGVKPIIVPVVINLGQTKK